MNLSRLDADRKRGVISKLYSGKRLLTGHCRLRWGWQLLSSRVVEAFDACRKKHADGAQWIFDTDPASASPYHVYAVIEIQVFDAHRKSGHLWGKPFSLGVLLRYPVPGAAEALTQVGKGSPSARPSRGSHAFRFMRQDCHCPGAGEGGWVVSRAAERMLL